MKRAFETHLEFKVITSWQEFGNVFSTDWKYKDMLSFMIDTYSIDEDDIIEVHQTFVKSYRILIDD